jgi:hypothetical protein
MAGTFSSLVDLARASAPSRNANRGRQRRKWHLEALEDRVNPVLGAYDLPALVAPTGAYTGVVRLNAATGTLLSTGRHLVTAAHVVGSNPNSNVTFEILDTQGNPKTIKMKTKAIFAVPGEDFAVVELADFAPFSASRFTIYSGSDELGKTVTLVGYGNTGTGTSGGITAVLENGSQGQNREVVRLTINGAATGGLIGFGFNDNPQEKVALPHNFTPGQLAQALKLLPGVLDAQVRKIGDTNPFNNGVVDNPNHPYAGTYEIVFKETTDPTRQVPPLLVTNNLTGPNPITVDVEMVVEGGTRREKRIGFNKIGAIDGTQTRLLADFDDGTAVTNTLNDGLGFGALEGFFAAGDSGAPVFINGKIAAVHKGRQGPGVDGVNQTSDFGEQNRYVRASIRKGFVDSVLARSYDLALDMRHQAEGDDGVADSVRVSQVGNQVRVFVNGVLRHADAISRVKSIRVIGSTDDEVIQVINVKKDIPVVVTGNSGADNIQIIASPLTARLLVQGQNGDDTILIDTSAAPPLPPGPPVTLAAPGAEKFSVEGNAGQDRVTFFNFASAVVSSITVRSTTIGFRGRSVSYSGVEDLSLVGGKKATTTLVDSLLQTTDLHLFGGGANDYFRVGLFQLPGQVKGEVSIDGNAGSDRVDLLGTVGEDTLTVNRASFDLAPGNVQGLNVETVYLNGLAGLDRVIYDATDGQAEQVTLAIGSATVVGSGALVGTKTLDVLFTKTERVEVRGGPRERDQLTVLGTAADDRFAINLTAAGTDSDPALRYLVGGSTLLTLVGHAGIDSITVNSGAGADTFDVSVKGTTPQHTASLAVAGGAGADKVVLHIEDQPVPEVTDQAFMMDWGVISVLYPSRNFGINYAAIESKEFNHF